MGKIVKSGFYLIAFCTSLVFAMDGYAGCEQNFKVQTKDGETEVSLCGISGVTTLRVESTLRAFPEVFAITDADGIIQRVQFGRNIKIDPGDGLSYRIYAVGFIGGLNKPIGEHISQASFSRICYTISRNYITIDTRSGTSSNIRFTDGSEAVSICAGDSKRDELTVDTDYSGPNSYIYIITDGQNLILDSFSVGYDFNGVQREALRIYGLSYSDSLVFSTGDHVQTSILSTGCFGLSDNFLRVSASRVDGGMINSGGSTGSLELCRTVDNPLTIELSTSSTSGSYAYLLTNFDNDVIRTSLADSISLEGLGGGRYRVFGISYTGVLSVTDSVNVFEALDSTACYDLSANFLTLNVRDLGSTDMTFENGLTVSTFCQSDVEEGITIPLDDSGDQSSVWVLTDTNFVIRHLIFDEQINFSSDSGDIFLVYRLAYSGDLLADTGKIVVNNVLASGCFDVTEEPLTLIVGNMQAGTISETIIRDFICLGDNRPDKIRYMANTSTPSSYGLILTDTAGVVLRFIDGTEVSYGSEPEGTYRLYGVAYSTEIDIAEGVQIDEVQQSGACIDITDAFVSISVLRVTRGFVSVDGVQDSLDLCTESSGPTPVPLSIEADFGREAYLILTYGMDDRLFLLDIITDSLLNMQDYGPGRFALAGLSYQGTLDFDPNESITDFLRKTECIVSSNNIVDIRNVEVDGGEVRTIDGDTVLNITVNDSIPDSMTFVTTSLSTENYVYVLTDQSDVVSALITDGVYDFDNDDEGTVRIWGVSYSGVLGLEPGDTLTSAVLSTDCYELSTNFVVINKAMPLSSRGVTSEQEEAKLDLRFGGDHIQASYTGSKSESLEYALYTINGRIMYSGVSFSENWIIPVSGLELREGIYLFSCKTPAGIVTRKVFLRF